MLRHFLSHSRFPRCKTRSHFAQTRSDETGMAMQLEFHQLDRRWEHGRAHRPDQLRRLLASLADYGQQIPIVVVGVAGQPDRYLVIDGYQRIQALEQLGRDTVEAVVWPSSELEAVLLEHAMRMSRRMTALEEGCLLQELERRFGYGVEDLARRFDRSPSWVSRRLAMLELLPEEVQQRVRTGEITAHLAVKFLAPMAKLSREDCQRMAEIFARRKGSTREAGQLYDAWRDGSAAMRQRILREPELFLKAQRERDHSPPPPSAAALLCDIWRRSRRSPRAPTIGWQVARRWKWTAANANRRGGRWSEPSTN
jgi:ParB family transcriptional regulator, chromosome partitioning protein